MGLFLPGCFYRDVSFHPYMKLDSVDKKVEISLNFHNSFNIRITTVLQELC